MNRWIIEMREYHYEIKYVQGKYNYVADQLSRSVRIVQRCLTTTILGLTSEEFIKCQKEEVKWREMIEYLRGRLNPNKEIPQNHLGTIHS